MSLRTRPFAGAFVFILCGLIFAPAASLLGEWDQVDASAWSHILATSLGETSLNTLCLVLTVCSMSLVLGASLALASVMQHLPRWLDIGLALPLLLPKYVLGFSYLSLTDYAGPLQTILRSWGIDASPYLQTGMLLPVAFVMTLALFPYVFLLVREGLSHVDYDTIASARLMGASDLNILYSIALPVVRPWLLSGLLLVGLECLSDFGTVAIFNFDTFTTLLYKTWFGLQSFSLTAQLGSLILFLCVGFFLVQSVLTRRRLRYQSDQVSTLTQRVLPERKTSWTLFGTLLCLLGFVIPLGHMGTLCLQLDSWPRGMGEALWNTVVFAASTGATIILFTSIFVGVTRRDGGRTLALVKALTRTGYAIPGIILATGVLLLVTAWDHLWPDSSPWIISGTAAATVLGLSIKFFMLGQDSIQNRLKQIPLSLEESAQLMGAGDFRLMKDIYGPLFRRTLTVTFLVVFIETAKEMPITLMTRSFGGDTLAIKIFEYTSEGQYAYAAVPSIVLCLLGIGLALVLPKFKS